ncbi:MAG: PTS transporter subunit EIIC [Erysipelotrichaceae bacterium]|nr:PTS transporter subunit EIIC [Erysipelotrichaceae bacterium]MDY5252766.1 PTS transporter subunit EIIC [Erysipelotrichaceae bacterium]
MTNQKRSFINVLTDFIENRLAPPLVRISQIRYLQTLQRTFMVMMPYLILGSAATLILNLGGLFAEGTGLNMPEVATAINNVIANIRPGLTQIVFISINLMAFLCVLLNSYFLGEHYNLQNKKINPIVCGVVGMISFLCFIDFTTLSANFDWPAYILGAPSLFSSIIISILAVEIYRWFINKNITIKMPAGVPPMVADAFTSIIPVSVVVIISAFVGRNIANFDFLNVVNELCSHLVVGGSTPIAQFIAYLLDRVFWFVGLHGSNIVGSIMTPIWEAMVGQNLADFTAGKEITYVFSSLWVNCYVRLSVFPIALLLVMSKVKRFKVLGKLSIAGSIFNIAEPIMYGLPIVLNPLMFVPWVIGGAFMFIFNVALTMLGLVPPIVANVVWTMPVPLMAFIGSGFKISAMVISIINMVILFFIYLPFFKVMEKQELAIEKENEQKELMENING